MKRLVLPLFSMVTAACAPTGSDGRPSPPPPAIDETAECDAAPAQSLIGQAASAELGADAIKRTGARTLRWIQPGTMVTMDFRPDRLNINLDEKNVVTRLTCG